MPHRITFDWTRPICPARALAVMIIIARVKAQAGNLTEDMPFACINRDPPSMASAAKAAETARSRGRIELASRVQNVRDRPGAIVGTVFKARMPTATAVRFHANSVAGGNGPQNRRRCVGRWHGLSTNDDGRLARHKIIFPPTRAGRALAKHGADQHKKHRAGTAEGHEYRILNTSTP